MNCWHCKTELIWGGDHDLHDPDEPYAMVEVYKPVEDTE
jgi:hypothetical protein